MKIPNKNIKNAVKIDLNLRKSLEKTTKIQNN